MIPDGMVFMPFCFENAPANLLTNQALDPDGKIPELKYCAAKIENHSVTPFNPIPSYGVLGLLDLLVNYKQKQLLANLP